MSERDKDYVQTVADGLIKQLKQGTSPFQKPWEPGTAFLPHNPKTGTVYSGVNAVWLLALSESKGYEDKRWLTYKQATELGGQVQKGEKGAAIQYWQWSESRGKTGPDGRPVRDGQGNQVRETVKLDRPRVKNFVVFNAEQISGLPEMPGRSTAPAWERQAAAESILDNSGASIRHQAGNRAYYSQGSDQITLPERAQFDAGDDYYATALHELGHWTGHPDRLNRETGTHPFGSPEYAKEELRAEIASLMLGDQLGIGHDPGKHASYVGSWIKALEEDPREIFRAAADASKIAKYVMSFDQRQTLQAEAVPDEVKAVGPVLDAEDYGKTIDRGFAGLDGSDRLAGEAYLAAHTAIFLGQDPARAADGASVATIADTWQQEGVGLKSANALIDRARRSATWPAELAGAMGLDAPAGDRATDFRGMLNGLDWADGTQLAVAHEAGGQLADDRLSAELTSAVWQAVAPEEAVAPDWFIPAQDRENAVARAMDGGTPSLALIDALALDPVPPGRGLREVDAVEWAAAAATAGVETAERPAAGDRIWIDHSGQRIADATPPLAGLQKGKQESTMPEGRTPAAAVDTSTASSAESREIARDNTYIDVPFTQKEEAKGLGAKWDRREKSWYVPAGGELAAFAKWRGAEAADRTAAAAPGQGAGPLDPTSAQAQFADALKGAGFVLTGQPVMDGSIQRVKVQGDKGPDRSGAYVGYLDGKPAGWFQNHREGSKTNWKATGGESLTAAERAQLAKDAERAREERRQQTETKHAAAAGTAAALWASTAEATTDHAYLARKQVGPNGIRLATPATVAAANQAFGAGAHQLRAGDLVVPMKGGPRNELRSLQFIGENGRKGFMPGGEVIGTSHRIGDVTPGAPVLVGEGFATAASIHQATGYPVEVAFNASNLSAVAEKVRRENPDAAIVIAGDDDRHLEQRDPPRPNIGKEKAEEAAKKVGGIAVLPTFGAGQDGVDWNDVATKEGPQGLNRELKDSINREQRREYRDALEDHMKPASLAARTEDRLATIQDASNALRVSGPMTAAMAPAVAAAPAPVLAVANEQVQTQAHTQTQSRRVGR